MWKRSGLLQSWEAGPKVRPPEFAQQIRLVPFLPVLHQVQNNCPLGPYSGHAQFTVNLFGELHKYPWARAFFVMPWWV